MNQGLLIVVLLLLVLLLSCKAFNYCVLRELFVNKETVKQMMDDIYGVRENFEPCSEDRRKGMTLSSIAEICDDFVGEGPKRNQRRENFQGCEPGVSGREELVEAGKCEELKETFRCCKDEDDLLKGGCQPQPCEGFVNYSPFKETFQDVPDMCKEDPGLCDPSRSRRSD